MVSTRRYVFGLVPAGGLPVSDDGRNGFVQWIGQRADAYVVRREVQSYDELARMMMSGNIDIAWLPPLVYLELERRGGAEALVTSKRGGRGEYACVVVVRDDSPIRSIADLVGTRAAWIDPLSASGYVYPRIKLAEAGHDPRTCFASETFFGSHDVALAAVSDKAADFAATFASTGADGKLRGRWCELPSAPGLRVLETLGHIPMDLVGVHPTVPQDVRARVAAALVDACHDEKASRATKRIFDVDSFGTEGFSGYDALRSSLYRALNDGIIDASSAFIATIPPPD